METELIKMENLLNDSGVTDEDENANSDKSDDSNSGSSDSGNNKPVAVGANNMAVAWLNFGKKNGVPYLNVQTALGDFPLFFQAEERKRLIKALGGEPKQEVN